MQGIKWLAVLMAGILIAACFFPWVSIESSHIVIGGFKSDIPDYGKPGVLHVALCSVCIMLMLLRKIWSVRTAFFLSAFNIAWAARNFFIISACRAGICPQKHPALYIELVGSIVFTILILFADTSRSNKFTSSLTEAQ